jgi:type IV fimbrial biogenesis protein FimT
MRALAQRGFTLIEMMIALLVVGILFAMALPTFSVWIANTKIRNGAEAVLNGLQYARNEAVKRNTTIEFEITSGTAWVVTVVSTAAELQRRAEEGSSDVSATATPGGATKVTFNGMGWVTDNADGSARVARLDVTSSQLSSQGERALRLVVTPGGSVKMCDPAVASPDPRACP